MKGRVLASLAVTIAVIAAMAAGPALADSGRHDDRPFGYGYRPGWGHGDGSHIHTGPPGLEENGEARGNGKDW